MRYGKKIEVNVTGRKGQEKNFKNFMEKGILMTPFTPVKAAIMGYEMHHLFKRNPDNMP